MFAARPRIAKPGRSILAGVLIALGSLGGGCHSNEYAGANELIAHHFDRLANEDYSSALAEYAPAFFARNPRAAWETKLRNMRQNLGELQSYRVSSATVRREASGEAAGTYVAVGCQSRYPRFRVQEELIYFKPRGHADFQIVQHRLASVKEL